MVNPSISAENYRENEPLDYKAADPQYLRNIDFFRKCDKILYPTQRNMYEYVRNYCIDFVKNHPQYPKFIWKPKIVDVGCGGGWGANILSQEGDFVWGIDIDDRSILWAKEVFTRNKNNIYYTPQLSFEVVDILNEPRELMAFDIVVCIEVIEHIEDYQKVLDFLKRLCKKDKKGVYLEPLEATKVFISTTNRNWRKQPKEHPGSSRHVREWIPAEFYKILEDNFKYVTLMNTNGDLVDLDMTDESMFFKVETPK